MASALESTYENVELARVMRYITARRVQRGFVRKCLQGKDSSTDATSTGCITSKKIVFEEIPAENNTSKFKRKKE